MSEICQNEVIDVSMASLLIPLNRFTHCTGVSIVHLEQVNASWVYVTLQYLKDQETVILTQSFYSHSFLVILTQDFRTINLFI